MRSLRARVALSAAVVLAIFILLTSLALERAFRDSARSAREERLLGQLYLLMAAAEAEDDRLLFPKELAEARFNLPDSGLYGAVLETGSNPIWRSTSAVGVDVPLPRSLPAGERRFDVLSNASDQEFLAAAFGITWATGDAPQRYTFVAVEDLSAYEQELSRFHRSLAGWLGFMALLMLAALLLTLHWGLAPLGRVAGEITKVESGRQGQIRGDYPTELQGLTGSLNALLAHERAQQAQLGNALGDLAHSLKTPLAVMRGAVDTNVREPLNAELFEEQLSRMDNIVQYQLQRARSRAGAVPGLAPPIRVRPLVERLCASLSKVYRSKGVDALIEIDPELQFRGAEGDLMELLGNLLDNAFKWCGRKVRTFATGGDNRLELTIEDDGPGVAPALVQQVIERGTRADEETPGHGIGLAVAQDISAAYDGVLSIGRSELGGARLHVRLGHLPHSTRIPRPPHLFR